MKHFASRRFWALYQALPAEIRDLADKNFALLKCDPRHPSLHFKQISAVWSVRIGSRYRAIGHSIPDGVHWFWIGTHADYDKVLR